MYGGVDVQLPVFLTSALDGGEWSYSRSGRFTPGERASGTHWLGGWVGFTAGLEAVENRKILCPWPKSNPVLSKVKVKGKVVPVLFRLTDHHAMKAYWESGGIAPRFLDVGTRWRWVVSFTLRPHYPQGKSPW
jgi:hypothetical protein